MDIEKTFTFHDAKHVEKERFEEIREAAKKLGFAIQKNGGHQQDKNLAIQKLRECVHFAIASIVIPEDTYE